MMTAVEHAPIDLGQENQAKEERKKKAATLREGLANAAEFNDKRQQESVPFPLPTQLPPLRENLVQNAIEYLTEPRIVKSPDDRKRRFLKTKRLTDEEIDEGFRRAGIAPVPTAVQPAPEQLSQDSPPRVAPATIGPLVTVVPAAPTILQVPWKSMLFVILTFTEIGRLMFYFVKIHLFPIIWKPKKSKSKKKSQGIHEEIKIQINKISARVSEQSTEIVNTLGSVKSTLGKPNKIKSKEDLEPSQISPIRKEIMEIENMLPKVTAPPIASDSTFSQHYPLLQESLSNIKNTIIEANGGAKSFSSPWLGSSPYSYTGSAPTYKSDPILAKQTTMPWKVNSQSSKPDWLEKKPSLPWLQAKKDSDTLSTPLTTSTTSDTLTTSSNTLTTSSNTLTTSDTPPVTASPAPAPLMVAVPPGNQSENLLRKKAEGVQMDETSGEKGENGKNGVYSGDLQKVVEMAQKRKKKELAMSFDEHGDNLGYSESFKKMAEAVSKLPANLKPEDFPGVRKIDDAPIEEFKLN